MKKNLLTLCIAVATVFPVTTLAQQEVDNLTVKKGNELSREYLRPSISTLYFTDGSNEANQIVKYLQYMGSEQFDVNSLKQTFAEANASNREQVDEILRNWKVGNQIMQNWFPEFINEQEGYSLKVLENRGKYAATDADVLRDEASYRNSTLNNLGEKLIDRSYIQVYYIYRGKTSLGDIVLSEMTKNNRVGVKTYIYKLDFNDGVRTDFYENYFNKPNGIEMAAFPLTFVLEHEKKISISKDDGGNENYATTAGKIFSKMEYELSNKVNDFKVRTAVMQTSPIRVKIGRKEGVKTDDRYDVMELVLNREGHEVARRKAVVRVGNYIADNRSVATGSTTDMTKFYKFLGGSVKEGMTLVKKGELGFSVSPYASLSGIGMMLDYRTKLIPSFFVYLKGDLPVGEDSKGKKGINYIYSKFTFDGNEIKGSEKDAHTLFRAGFGVMKEFYFARNLVVGAGVGAGRLFATESENNQKLDFKVLYGEAIGRFGIQFSPNFQLFAQADYNYYFGEGIEYGISGYGKTVTLYDGEYFNKQLSQLGIGVGAKISF
ncbi:hypothetical protein [Riemerella columbina]|uniref:hypothetical protein n=1 Tax=Riemerella columbina TaxID=103810 RepID=UPI000375678A|nr:hypothetical protein [Riemerella columbina]